MILLQSFDPANDIPSCLAGFVGSYSVLPPLRARSLALALVALSSRSFDRWYIVHCHSFVALSAGSSADGTSRTSAPSGAVDRSDDVPGLWQMVVGSPFNLGRLHIQASLPWMLLWYWRCPRAPSAGDALYTGALRSTLRRWYIRQCRSSTALPLTDRLFHQHF